MIQSVEVICSYCTKPYQRPKNAAAEAERRGWAQCCSRECHKKRRTTSETRPCGHCGKDVIRRQHALQGSKSGRVFCNKSCATSHNNQYKKGEKHPNYTGGFSGYRDKALKHYAAVCSNEDCPMTIEVPVKMLDVHHIDSDRTNNELENLRVLCVWCHALETRKIAVPSSMVERLLTGSVRVEIL